MGSQGAYSEDVEPSNGTNGSSRLAEKIEFSNGSADSTPLVSKIEPAIIRPAAKTQRGLYFLSNIDQFMTYILEIVFTFKGSSETASAEILKDSLAKVLVEFYPYAGCLATTWDGKLMVNCTGEGVHFAEAVSDQELDELGDISFLDPVKMGKLLHRIHADNFVDFPPLTVQVTRFKCGGIALGIRFNHVFTDGTSLANFLISWGEVARGVPLSVPASLDRSILSARHPPKVEYPHFEFRKEDASSPFNHGEPHVYQSFCFDPQKLTLLKKIARDDESLGSTPTTFEVITALAWLLRTKALKFGPNETTKLLIAADTSSKFKPPLPKGYFGNAIAWLCAECKAGELMKKPLSSVVKIVNDTTKMATEGYTRSAIDHYEVTRRGLDFENTCYVTKWSRLPLYDLDFGWGKPHQVAPASLVDNLMVILTQENESPNTVLSLGLPGCAMKIFEELMETEL